MSRGLIAVVAFALAACNLSSLSGQRELVRYYSLDSPGAFGPDPALDDRTLAVEAMQGLGHLDQAQMIRRFSRDALAYQLYPENHRWGQIPREMATELALQQFQRCFRRVVNYPTPESPDLVLALKLLRFEEVRPEGAAQGVAWVRLEGRLTAIDEAGRTVSEVPLAAEVERPVAHPSGAATDYAALATAMRSALVTALEQIREQFPAR